MADDATTTIDTGTATTSESGQETTTQVTPSTTPPATQTTQVNPDGGVTLQLGINAPSDSKKLLDQIVPDAQKGKDWYQNISKTEDPMAEFWKRWENRESLIGRQMTVNAPDENATPEQIATYRKAIGVPDTADEYKYAGLTVDDKDPDKEIVTLLNQARPEAFMKAAADAAHKMGITPKQFAAYNEFLDKEYIKTQKAAMAEYQQQRQTQEADVVKRSTEIFGARLPQVKANADKFLAMVPENVRALAPAMDANARIVLAAMFDAVHQNYVKEDRLLPTTSNGGTTAGSDYDSLYNERLAIMQSKAFSDSADPGYKAAGMKVKALNEKMRQIQK